MHWLFSNPLLPWFVQSLLLLAGYVNWRFNQNFWASLDQAPSLKTPATAPATLPTISVVIPAYNEAINLQDCVNAVLNSRLPQPETLRVWIADDESTDTTGAIARKLVAQDPRVHLVAVPPRPTHEIWRGKNWACAQAVVQAEGEYLLFIDADVRLEPDAIATALSIAQASQADLISCWPDIICGCLAEWLVQPLMLRILIAGFNISSVNDPNQDVAFAAGPFMLFRRTAYDQIGGHQSVAADPVEDVALASKIKAAGLRMRLSRSGGLVKVRMYRDWSSLWEGWTKNMHLGAGRKVSATLMIAVIGLFGQTVAWLGLGATGLLALTWPVYTWLLPGCSAVVVVLWQLWLWHRQAESLRLPPRYWWLTGLGGILVAAIALGSIIKTETGWGWTWRGRSLAIDSPKV
jgi:cellulose synthase/poly-beta-1,6-N-acetylglucosamine synthase-like glycosyltransferase